MEIIDTFIQNGFYIHFFQAFLYSITKNIYISSIIAMKMYSTNYFYWYGNHFSYLSNRRYNWVKQFIRFTDTGHLASVLPLVYSSTLPVSHNIHFIIMSGYWIGKLAFNLKDADKLKSTNIIEWHMDLCTYIHHSLPYLLIHYLYKKEGELRSIDCNYEYSNQTLKHTYLWLYSWFLFIYIPWRMYTNDTVYSILDTKQTPKKFIFGFVFFMNLLVFISNYVGYASCKLITN